MAKGEDDIENGEALKRRLEKTTKSLMYSPVLLMSSLTRGVQQGAIFLTFYDFPMSILTIQILLISLVNTMLNQEIRMYLEPEA